MSSMRAECDCVLPIFSIVAFLSSAFICGIYSEPWFQKCPKLTITQAEKEKIITSIKRLLQVHM